MRIVAFALLALVALGYGAAKFFLYYKTTQTMENLVASLAPVMQVKYGGISSTFTGELAINDLVLRLNEFEDEISIAHLGLKTPHLLSLIELGRLAAGMSSGGLPSRIGFFAEQVHIPSGADYYQAFFDQAMRAAEALDLDEPHVKCVGKYGMFSPEALKAMGYRQQLLSFATTLEQKESQFIVDFNTAASDMYDLSINLALGGNMMAELSQGAAYRPKLSSLRVEYTDRSIVKRVKRYCRKLGLSPEQIIESHVDSLHYFGQLYGIVFDEYVVNPYKEFFTGKSKLIITAQPRRLIDFSEISHYNPNDVPALLNLEAVAQ